MEFKFDIPENLTKSYVNMVAPNSSTYSNSVFSELFDKARQEKKETLLVNMDTGERKTNLDILEEAKKYEKGLQMLELEPGVDNIAVIGCATWKALAISVAAAELGFGFAHLFFHPPRNEKMATQLPVLSPKVLIIGEATGGHNFDTLMGFFDAEAEKPNSDVLPFVEHIFYDSSYKDRSPSQKFIKTLNSLGELGESVTDELLLEAKKIVKPDFIVQQLFTSGSTGAPKCSSRTHASLLSFLLLGGEFRQVSTITANFNVDTLTGYIALLQGLLGMITKVVMIPESYEECPLKGLGKILTQAIIDEEITQSGLTMSMLSAITDYMKDNSITLPHKMAMIGYGGQHVTRQFQEQNEKLLGGVSITGYGMTEAIFMAFCLPGQSPEAMSRYMKGQLTVIPGTELRIANEKDEPVDIGEIGEIQAITPLAIKEYRNDEKRTKELFTDDGFIRTGDAGVMNSNGTIQVQGRMNAQDRFKIYGKVEYAQPIETILSQHPNASQVFAVSGKENDWIGDEITCCIKLKKTASEIPEKEIFDLPLYNRQRPARILYFEEFPLTDNLRKVSKLKLTEQVRKMIAEDDELGKCSWFAEHEKSGKTY